MVKTIIIIQTLLLIAVTTRLMISPSFELVLALGVSMLLWGATIIQYVPTEGGAYAERLEALEKVLTASITATQKDLVDANKQIDSLRTAMNLKQLGR